MRRISLVFIVLILLLFSSCERQKSIYDVEIASIDSKGNYSFGRLLAEDSDANGIIVSGGYFAKGVYDSQKDAKAWFTANEMNTILHEYQEEYLLKKIIGDKGKEYLNEKDIAALPMPTALQDKFSYVWGYANSPEMYTGSIGVDIDCFVAGYLSFLYEHDSLLSKTDEIDAFSSWQESISSRYDEEMNAIAEENSRQANDFLSKNKNDSNVIVLSSGLQLKQIKVLESGVSPNEDSEVVVDYRLSLLDGSVADEGTDVAFKLNSLIPGFSEAVMNMRVGESIIAYVPPELGYGSSDLGTIRPNSLLIFEIALKEIK